MGEGVLERCVVEYCGIGGYVEGVGLKVRCGGEGKIEGRGVRRGLGGYYFYEMCC